MVIHLMDSLLKGTRILYIDSNESRAVNIETQAEADPLLSRAYFYVAHNLQSASRIIREHNVDICLFPDGLDDHDFVYLQKEFQSANQNIKLIPLIGKIVTLEQLNEFRESTSVVSFADNDIIGDFTAIKNEILNAVREIRIAEERASRHSLEKIQNSLLVDHEDWKQLKMHSSFAIHYSLVKFDLSAQEKTNIELAEMIFFPWIITESYKKIVTDSNILEVLCSSGSWQDNRSPESFPGLLLTVSNYAAWCYQQDCNLDDLIKSFDKRSYFLKHRSMRSMDIQFFQQLESVFENIPKAKAV